MKKLVLIIGVSFTVALTAIGCQSNRQVVGPEERVSLQSSLWVSRQEAALGSIQEAALSPTKDIPTRAMSPGPLITINSPSDGQVCSKPVAVDIGFSPPTGSAIDLSSLKVRYLKLGLEKDITEHVTKYASQDGIKLSDAPLPAGKHTIEISLADTDKHTSRQRISFEIR